MYVKNDLGETYTLQSFEREENLVGYILNEKFVNTILFLNEIKLEQSDG